MYRSGVHSPSNRRYGSGAVARVPRTWAAARVAGQLPGSLVDVGSSRGVPGFANPWFPDHVVCQGHYPHLRSA